MSTPSASPLHIRTEEDAQRFLTAWPVLIQSHDSRDKDIVGEALVELRRFPELDTAPFFLACLQHHNVVFRGLAVEFLGEKINQTIHASKVEIDPLLDVFRDDPVPVVRGMALRMLGSIAKTHNFKEIWPLLLAVVTDASEDNTVRLQGYIGLIQLTDEESTNPKRQAWILDLNKSVEEQVDWEWIKELQQRYPSG